MTAIKVELQGGVAYILDEWGNVWQLVCEHPHLPEIRCVTRLDPTSTNQLTEPQLARFAT